MLAGVPVSQLEPYFAALESAVCLLVCRAWKRAMDSEVVWAQRLSKQAWRDGNSGNSLFFSLAWLKTAAREKHTHARNWTTSTLLVKPPRRGERRRRYRVQIEGPTFKSCHTSPLPKRPRLDVAFLSHFKHDFGLFDDRNVDLDTVEKCEDQGAIANRTRRTNDEPTSKLVVQGNLARMAQERSASEPGVRRVEGGVSVSVVVIVIVIALLLAAGFSYITIYKFCT